METSDIQLLIVEDNQDDAELLREYLFDIPGTRIRVDTVERLAGALTLLAEKPYDIMLLDLSLPDAHGLDTLAKVRVICPYLPIVIMTGLNDQAIAYEAARAGAQDYLVKGRVDPELLGRSIRYAIERARNEQELREHRDHLGELVEQRTAALREKTERLQLLATAIEHAAEAMFIADAETRIQYANPAFEALTGYTLEEVRGNTPRIIRSDMHTEQFFSGIYAAISADHPWHGQIVNKKKDGTLYTSDVVISCVNDEQGTLRNYVYMGRDVTEDLKLRERLNRAERLESIGQLAGGIAHDFNNILHAILGFATLNAKELPEESELHKNNVEICSAAKRAADLTRQLLAFSRRQLLKREPLDINVVIDRLLGMLRRLVREDIELDFVPGHQLGTVEADVGQFEQVLVNLIVNARDALAGSGRITVETENVLLNGSYTKSHPWAKPGRYVLLSVTDTGQGMPAHVLDKIFEPFFTTKGEGAGTGLGLATVYGIVKQHDGIIHCYSEEGKGTTFKIYLPMSSRSAETVGPKIETAPSGGNETILVVEDDTVIRTLGTRILTKAGYTVLGACDGIEALELLASGAEVDLIVSDVVMPRLGGLELYARLKERGNPPPLLLASGYGASGVDPEMLSEKGVAIVRKPYSPDELLRKIRGLLDN